MLAKRYQLVGTLSNVMIALGKIETISSDCFFVNTILLRS